MVSRPTRGTSRRLTASSATSRTVQRAWPFWRIAAYHRDDALFLVGVQYLGSAGTLFLIQRTIQSSPLVAMAEASNRLRSERDHPGNLRGTGMLSQLQQGQGTQDHPDLLHSALHHSS